MNAEHGDTRLPDSLRDEGFRLEERSLSAAEALALYAAVGWTETVCDEETVAAAHAHSLYSVCVLRDSRVVAAARIVGDGGIYFYLQDVIVLPELQGRGLGRVVFEACCSYLDAHAPANAFVGLMAATGAAGFYERYGFRARLADQPGMVRRWHT
jgi:ribosomal protein S18 acetylase RimI-like enzyme